jgi:D-sedoheptulose 7-phosphate isomerase
VNDVVAGSDFAPRLRALGREQDIAIAIAPIPDVGIAEALMRARGMGMLTLALIGAPIDIPVDHAIVIDTVDTLIFKEACVAAYHILWELVHVILERTDIVGTL